MAPESFSSVLPDGSRTNAIVGASRHSESRRIFDARASCVESPPRVDRAVNVAEALRIARSRSPSARASSVKVRMRCLVLLKKASRSRARSRWKPSRMIGFGILAGREELSEKLLPEFHMVVKDLFAA